MPELIALRAAFGQDEANHGIRRYRVGGDGLVHVPAEAAFFLVSKGGFAVAKTTVARVPGGSLPAPLLDGTLSAADPTSWVRLHRGILPATQDLHPGEHEVRPWPIGPERSSVGDATSTASP